MDTESLFNLLSTFTRLSGAFQKGLLEHLGQETYKPHQILHAAGHLENRLYYLQAGFARNYYFDDRGNEHTVRFWEVGDIMFSFEGYCKVPSYFYTEIMEHAKLITISYSHLYELDQKFPETSIIIRKILLQFNREEYERRKMITLSAEERYRTFQKLSPDLFQKLPYRIIASYLQMSRETLTKFIGKR
jgi:CRP-like cAMP-binding protein